MSTWMFKAVFSIKPQQEILLSFSVWLQTVASTTHSNKGTRKSSKKWCCTWEELHRARHRGAHLSSQDPQHSERCYTQGQAQGYTPIIPRATTFRKKLHTEPDTGAHTYHPKVQDVQEDVIHIARHGVHTYHPKIHDIQKDVTHRARHRGTHLSCQDPGHWGGWYTQNQAWGYTPIIPRFKTFRRMWCKEDKFKAHLGNLMRPGFRTELKGWEGGVEGLIQ